MKYYNLILPILLISSLLVPSVFADDVSELKTMISQMREMHESQMKILEEKIERLEASQNNQGEEKLAEIKEEIKQEIKDESWKTQYVGRYEGEFEKGGLEIESPSGISKVTVGGYMDHEFANFENSHSTFDQHRWVINIGAQLGERVKFFSEYEIEHGGPDASGSGEAKVEQAYLDYLINDWINLRAGALLVSFGRSNIYHDADIQDLTARSIVSRDIIPTTWTESGVGFFGEFEPILGSYEDLVINYEVQIINGLDDGFSDTGLGGARGSLSGDNNNNKAVVGRLILSPAIGHAVGLSAYTGKYNTFGDSISGKAIDFISTWGPLELIGEFAYFNVNEPDFAESGITDIADEFQGYSIQANYHFWLGFLNDTFLGRKFEDPIFTLVNRYDWAKIDDDSDATDGDNEESRYTLGINYRPLESMVFKVEYQWNNTVNEVLERGDSNGWFTSVAMGF